MTVKGFANCKKCNIVFKKVYTPYCPTCYQSTVARFSEVYRLLQDDGDGLMTLEDIASRSNVPLGDIEELFFNGQLGTAAVKIVHKCQRCRIPITPINRKSRYFCITCTEKTEVEAKLDRPSNDPEDVRAIQERVNEDRIKKASAQANNNRSGHGKNSDEGRRGGFGFKRNTQG